MKTILVPVDFSVTARNCALYAASFARSLGVEKIILFNAYSIPLATEMSWAVLQTEELHQYSLDNLEDFAEMVKPVAGDGVVVETYSEFGFLTERIEAACEETDADIIVMGITGGGKIEEALIGSNTTHILRHTNVPVLIVPPDARWKPVGTIGWACDYKDVMKTAPANKITKIVTELSSRLVIVHNDPQSKEFDADKLRNNMEVTEMVKELNPQFVQVSEDNFSNAMNHFVDNHGVDMLMVIPKRQSWIDSLFHPSHTKQLAFHSHVPLLCIRSLDN